MLLPPDKLAYTIPEFCRVTGLKRTAIYSAMRCKSLIARKRGKSTLIIREDGVAYLASLPFWQPVGEKPEK